MLPWKRHKFEVAAAAAAASGEEEKATVSSSGWAAGGALVRLLGAGVGRRCRRRRTVRVSGEAPSYRVVYLGHAATLAAKGEGCTAAAVGRLWARSQGGRLGARMRLSIGPQGLRLAPEEEEEEASGSAAPRPSAHLYLLRRVTYCAADPRLPRLFAWVYRHEGRHKAVLLRCHAVLAPRAPQAQAMALRLAQAAAAALADFRRLKRRADAPRRPRPSPTPPAPLRRRLLLRALEPSPADRPRAAPRLRPIAEDALGEEREERDDGTPGLHRLVRRLDCLALAESRLPDGSRAALDGSPPTPPAAVAPDTG